MQTRAIPLTQGQFAIVDEADFDFLNQWKWIAWRSNRPKIKSPWYAVRTVKIDGKRVCVRMHRLIAGDPAGMDVDHRDGNSLNNTRQNLRAATKAQNCCNSCMRQHNKAGFKGVYPRGYGRYSAKVRFAGEVYYLGSFPTAESAAAAYQEKARELHGEFAKW